MEVTLLGIVTETIPMHFSKALLPMLTMLFERDKEEMFEQPWKALPPMVLTPYGISIDLMAVL